MVTMLKGTINKKPSTSQFTSAQLGFGIPAVALPNHVAFPSSAHMVRDDLSGHKAAGLRFRLLFGTFARDRFPSGLMVWVADWSLGCLPSIPVGRVTALISSRFAVWNLCSRHRVTLRLRARERDHVKSHTWLVLRNPSKQALLINPPPPASSPSASLFPPTPRPLLPLHHNQTWSNPYSSHSFSIQLLPCLPFLLPQRTRARPTSSPSFPGKTSNQLTRWTLGSSQQFRLPSVNVRRNKVVARRRLQMR